ncbi:HAD family hydrolase [Catellatospora coxensis]
MFVARQLAAHEAGLVPVPGIVEALNAITLPTCVASSGRHDKMRNTLGITGLYERFEGRIFSATEVANGKPAPDLFLHAAARMGADPARCVVVEDSRPGVQAARAAGMRVLAYAGGHTGRLANRPGHRGVPRHAQASRPAQGPVAGGTRGGVGLSRRRRPNGRPLSPNVHRVTL